MLDSFLRIREQGCRRRGWAPLPSQRTSELLKMPGFSSSRALSPSQAERQGRWHAEPGLGGWCPQGLCCSLSLCGPVAMEQAFSFLGPSRPSRPSRSGPPPVNEAAFANHLHLFLSGKMKVTVLGGISAFPSLSREKQPVPVILKVWGLCCPPDAQPEERGRKPHGQAHLGLEGTPGQGGQGFTASPLLL